MRKLYLIFVVLFSILIGQNLFAQVSVTATSGTTGPTSYTTLKGAFDAINAGTHQGIITISITANTTEGTTPATLHSSNASPASYTSVLIRPTSDGVSISGNPATGFGVIQFNGADNVTIDGDNPNTSGTNRNLTINNTVTNTTGYTSVIRIATNTNVVSADNITIQNCIITGSATSQNASGSTSTTAGSNTSFGIYVGGNGGTSATTAPTAISSVSSQTAPSGTTVNNFTVNNNSVNACARAIVFNGAATSVSTGVSITNNIIGASGSNSGAPPYSSPATTVYVRGILVQGTNALTVTGNTIQNILTYVATGNMAIDLNTAIGTGTTNISNNTITNVAQNNSANSNQVAGIMISSMAGTATVSGNTITNIQGWGGSGATDPTGISYTASGSSATFENNKVTTVYNRNASTWGVQGMVFNSGNNVTIRNNFIADINESVTGGLAFSLGAGVFGMLINGGTGHKVYHNSINLSGALLGTSNTVLTASFAIAGTGQTGIDVRNNIFANTMTNGNSSSANVAVFLPSSGTSSMNLTWNNNAYYTGSTAGLHGIAHVGTSYNATPAGAATYSGLYTAANFNAGSTAGSNNFRFYTSTLLAANTNNDNASFATTAAAPFTSSTDLHIVAGSNTLLESGGVAPSVTGVSTDIDAASRNTVRPDIGADEFLGACSAPLAEATGLVLTNSGNDITISYTNAATLPTGGYMVLRTTTSTQPVPVNGTTYTAGSTILSGTAYVEYVGTSTGTFTSTGLTPGQTYWYWVFTFNSGCSTAPFYTTTPLNGSKTVLLPCQTPASQPTNLVLTASSATSVSGTFTAVSGTSGYLVVRSTSSSEPNPGPQNATTYTVGSTALGAGTYVESVGSSTSFSSTGLTPGATYYYYVYSYVSPCATSTGDPWYLSSYSTPAIAALTGNVTTLSCPAPGTYSIGPSTSYGGGYLANYKTITAVINDLTTCGLTGNFIFELQSDYVSSAETSFPLTFPLFTGSSSYTVSFRPASGVTGRSITSSNTTGTILLTGGTRVIFDGQPAGTGGTRQLTIENTSTTGYAIRLVNGASNNEVKYCDVKSSNTTTGTPGGGTIIFSNSSAATGNNNNSINNCRIYDASAGTPFTAILSNGSSTSGKDNQNNVIANNEIYNFYNSAGDMNGVYLFDYSTSWQITGNSFYQTASRAMGSGTFSAIQTGTSTVIGTTISGNYIGGTGALASTPSGVMTLTGTAILRAMQLTAGTSAVTSVQSNTISNISLTSSSNSSSQSLISLVTGKFNVGTTSTPNVLGGGITVSLSSSTASPNNPAFSAILSGTGSPDVVNIIGNTIDGIAISGTSTTAGLAMINFMNLTGGSSVYTIDRNQIGVSSAITSSLNTYLAAIYALSSSTSNNISNNTVANITLSNTGAASVLYGIIVAGSAVTPFYTGNYNTTGNTIYNLSTAGTASPSVIGIYHYANVSSGQVISQNKIYNLNNTNSGNNTINLQGINMSSPTSGTNTVERNFIHSFNLSNTSISSVIYGIYVNSGNATYRNNMIRLGINAAGTAITAGYTFYGIREIAGVNNFYFNSIYIGGTGVAAGGSNTYAFLTAVNTGTREYSNNIFVNARSNTTTGGSHYAYRINGTTGLTSDYNDFFATGTGGVICVNGATIYTSLAAWKSGVSRDNNSISSNPRYLLPTGTSSTADLHIDPSVYTLIEGNGSAVAGVTDDYDGDARASFTPTDIGADAIAITAATRVDVGVTAIAAPVAASCYSSATTVTATIKNYSTSSINFALTPVTVSVTVSGAVSTTLTGTISSGSLAANGTVNVTMSSTLNMSTVGTYTFNSTIASIGGAGVDADITNDALTPALSITTTAASVSAATAPPYSQSFPTTTNPPTGWTVQSDTYGWLINSTHGNGTNGIFYNLWSTYNTATYSLLKLGPVISGSTLSFDYRIVNWSGYPATATPNSPSWGNFQIQVSSDCGNTFSTLATIDPSNHTSTTAWATKTYSLSAYAGSNIIIRVVATWASGDYFLDMDNINVVNPCTGAVGGTASALSYTICGTGSTTLSATGYSTGAGSAYQWQYSSDNFVSDINDLSGQTNPASASTGTLSTTTYFRLKVTCPNGVATDYSNIITIFVANPSVISTTGASTCGPGTVSLSATVASGTTAQWYTASTGGTAIGSGSPFTTPTITGNTTFYVASEVNSTPVTGVFGTSTTTNSTTGFPSPYTNYYGGNKHQMLILASELSARGFTAGNITSIAFTVTGVGSTFTGTLQNFRIDMKNTSSTVLNSSSFETGMTTSATTVYGPVAQSIPKTGFPATVTHTLTTPFTWDGTSNIVIQTVYSNENTGTSTDYVQMRYSDPGFVSTNYVGDDAATQPAILGYTIPDNAVNSRPNMTLTISSFCNSARTAVNVVYTAPPALALDASAATICSGSSTTVNVTGATVGNYTTYTWSPSSGATTSGSPNGSTVALSPTSATTYTLYATGGAGGCRNQATVAVTVNDKPASPTNVNGYTICQGASIPGGSGLTATTSTSTSTLSGSVVAGPTYNRCTAGNNTTYSASYVGTAVYYQVKTFTVSVTGSYTFNGCGSPTSFDVVGNIYINSFNPSSPATNFLIENDDANASCPPWGARVIYTLTAGQTYVFVTCSYYNGETGSYTWDVTGPGTLAIGSTNTLRWYASATGGSILSTTSPFNPIGVAGSGVANSNTPGTYTFYVASYNGTCESDRVAANLVINAINTAPTATYANNLNPLSICSGTNNVTLTKAGGWLSTGATWKWYSDASYTTLVGSSTASDAALTITAPVGVTTYYLRAEGGSGPCGSSTVAATSSVTVTVNSSGLWLGITTDWHNASNWCGGIPTTTTDVVIPDLGTGGTYPVISNGNTGNCKKMTININASVTVNMGGVLAVYGDYASTGTLNNYGELKLNSSSLAQSFPGATGTVGAMKSLTINNTSGLGVSLNRSFTIDSLFTPTAGSIDINNATITLASKASNTARVGQVGATFSYTGTGKFGVQRYYPANRSWRLVTSPLSSTGTIFDNWQNGGVYTPGVGMFVTGPNPTGSTGNGLDYSTQNNYSMKGYVNNAYVNISNTKTTNLSGTGSSAANLGYFTFVRGDRNRSPDNTIYGVSNVTTLTSTGKLQTGTQSFTVNNSSGSYTLIGNPYASPADFSKLTFDNVYNRRFYIFDPNINEVGAFVTMEDFDVPGTFTPTAPYGASSQGNHIQSSQAFFVQPVTFGTSANLIFEETHKSPGTNQTIFRPQQPLNESLVTNLYLLNPDGSVKLADGMLAEFNDAFSGKVDIEDALKFGNINETMSFFRNNYTMSVERRPLIRETDTLFIRLTKTVSRNYRFVFNPNRLAHNNLAGFLEDKFTGKSTPLNMNKSTTVDFTISGVSGSAAADRFRIVFRPSVDFTALKAEAVNSDIQLEWTVANEINLDQYIIERSSDNRTFNEVHTLSASSFSSIPVSYQWLDKDPGPGIYYYRIRSISRNGVIAFSNTVKVILMKASPNMYITPNPVVNSIINIQFNRLEAGVYSARLFNSSGQLVHRCSIIHAAGTSTEKINTPTKLSSGIYQLEITSPGKEVTLLPVKVD